MPKRKRGEQEDILSDLLSNLFVSEQYRKRPKSIPKKIKMPQLQKSLEKLSIRPPKPTPLKIYKPERMEINDMMDITPESAKPFKKVEGTEYQAWRKKMLQRKKK